VEEWTGAPALEAHFETPHLKNALARFPDLLAAELDVRRYRLVG
jgi:quinol monooxygenase YgiN